MRCLLSWCGCLTLLMCCGFAMCANSHDCDYAAYGGLRQRTDMVHGRVGSVFDPAPEVSYGVANGQSPQTAIPEAAAGEAEDRQSTVPSPSVDSRVPEGAEQPPLQEGTDRELPDGTIELPEFGPEDFPSDDLPSPRTLPPDLPGNGDRSARRHPLQGLFDDEF